MHAHLSLVTLGVRDLARARRFYEEGLGWKVSSASVADVVFFQLAGGLVLSLYPRALLAADAHIHVDASAAIPAFGGVTLAHLVSERLDVDALLATIPALGGTILKPAEDAFWGGRSGYFADPEGHAWEIAWNPHFPFSPESGVTLP